MTTVRLLDETARWKARDVRYVGGPWESVRKEIPEFELRPYALTHDEPENPFLQNVVRLPLRATERPIPVGVVSKQYSLASHRVVGELCLKGVREAGIHDVIQSEVGLSELGEWMNLRLYFPERFTFVPPDGEPLKLRLECFNSVDGSSRLVILLGWLRFVCSNGMVIGETKAEIRDIHNDRLDLQVIPEIIKKALVQVKKDTARLSRWAEMLVDHDDLEQWVDGELSTKWGKKAAARVLHICRTGIDAEVLDPFAPGLASEKRMAATLPVPGSPARAETLFDVSQALSWIATGRVNADERLAWQTQIPKLIQAFATKTRSSARA